MNTNSLLAALGAAFVSTLALSPAGAADLRDDHVYSGSLKDAPAPRMSWTGFYIGGHLGAAWTDASVNAWSKYSTYVKEFPQDVSTTAHQKESDTSLIGGAHAGYNWQRGSLVVGVEGDIDFSDHIDYLASFRGRIGVAAGNWLFYGTGGVALVKGGYDGEIAIGNGSLPYDTTDSQFGFVAGGGVEVKLSQKWSAGVEGLHYFFDGNTYAASGQNYGVTAESLSDITVVRGRLSYHLDNGYESLK